MLENLYDALIVGAIVLLAILVIGIIIVRLYQRASKELSFVRTGLGGQKVVMDGGAIVLPAFHQVIPVYMNTLKLEVARSGKDSLFTKAPCRTADHTRGAACCRDLQVEIMCTREETRLEALVRARQSPYLCKTERNEEDSIEAEMISACGYLGDDGVSCSLHGRVREDGRSAKPDLCSEWPEGGDLMHPGCVFRK